MKALVISTKVPFPVIDGGKKRVVNCVQALNDLGYRVDYLCYSTEGNNKGYEFGDYKYYHLSWHEGVKNILKSMMIPLVPYQTRMYKNNKILEGINFDKYDVIYVHLVRMAWIYEVLGDNKAIIDLTDSIAMNYSRIDIFSSSGVKDFIINCIKKIEGHLLRVYERRMSKFFNKCLVVSNIDKKFIDKNSNTIKILPVCIDDEIENISDEFSDKIVFFGNLDYEPNVKAIEFICLKLSPLLNESFPSLNIIIGGSGDGGYVKKLANRFSNVNVVGFVDDIKELYKNAFCSITPMFSGAGMQNKVLDSLRYGVPVISTRLGVGDINIQYDTEILIAENEIEYISRLKELKENHSKYEELSKKSICIAKNEYSFGSFVMKMDKIINE